MSRLLRLWRDRRGAAATEFAFAAPVLLIFVFGIIQLGQIYQANNGLNYGLDEAARTAILYPRPSDTTISARMSARKFGLDATKLTVTLTHSPSTATTDYVDISATYSVPVDFVMFTGPSITLTSTRRAYLAPST